MFTTNTITLTENQENKVRKVVEDSFSKLHSLDWNHFSFNGTRLNLKSKNQECIFEIHTEEFNSFWGVIEINNKKQPLIKTIKFIED
tara:strand:- start:164 stop:424 length:261 start_codon:yes stop_codon:yes gene_type:complete